MNILRLLARVLVAKPKICLFLTILFCALLGFFAPRLEIDASTQTLLLEHDKDLELFREVSKRYDTQNFLLIAYTPKDDLLSDESLNLIKNLSSELKQVPSVDSVFSVLNAPLLQNKKLSLSQILEHIPNLSDKDISKEKAKTEFLNSPFYKNQLVSSDFKTTSIVVNLKPNDEYNAFIEKINALEKNIENVENSKNNATQKATLTTQKSELTALKKEFKAYRDKLRISEHNNLEQIKQIIAKYNDNSLFLGGMDMIADDMISFVKSDLGTYGIATLALTMLCLWLYYLQLRYVFVAIFICALCVLSASGLFGLLGFEITVISSNYIALQLIITLSVTIHLINSYREFLRKRPHFNTRQITYLAIKDRFVPCFFAIFTTALGFISLVFCDIKPVSSLGIMMSASICVSLLICFCVFAPLMCLLPKKPVNTAFENFFTLTKHCAKIAINASGRKLIYIISAALFVIGIFGISKLEVENSFIGYFKESTDIYKGMEIIDTKLGGTVPLDIVISFEKIQTQNLDDFESEFADEFSKSQNKAQYWFNERRMSVLRKVSDFLENKEFIGSVNSLNNLLKVGKDLNEGRQLDALALALLYNGLSKEQKSLLLTPYVNIENDELHFSIRTTDSAPDLRRAVFLAKLESELNELLKNDNAKVQISGVMKLYANMLSSLFTSQIDSLAFVILSLFATFIVIFRSLKLALIAITINIVPLSCVLGAMGLIGLPLDIMSITIGSISLGIGVDNVIHYIYRYKIELAKSKDALIAVAKSHASIGYAMYYTSFAVFMGFGVMVTSNFWPTIYFGLLTDLVMFFMLISGFLLLPTLLISTKKFRF